MAQRSALEAYSASSSSGEPSPTRPTSSRSSMSSLSSLISEVSGKISSLKRQLSSAVKESEDQSIDASSDFECTHQTLAILDLLRWIFTYLTPNELCGPISQVCKEWYIESKSNLIWKPLCHHLWHDKAYVSDEFTDLVDKGLCKDAYLLSILDSERCELLDRELTSLTWLFRFKHEPAFLMAARLAQEENGEELSEFTDNQIVVSFGDAAHDKVVSFDTNHPWLSYRRYVWQMIDFDDDDSFLSIYSRHELRPRRSAKSKSAKSWISRVTDSLSSRESGKKRTPLDDLVQSRGFCLSSDCVQINQYPGLTVTRRDDWAFEMENQWVIFRSL